MNSDQKSPAAVARGRLGIAIRNKPQDTTLHAELRAEMDALRFEERVQELIDAAPELTDEQAGRIAAIFGKIRPA